MGLYEGNGKCQYTGLPYFSENCDCYIHQRQFIHNVKKKNTCVKPLKKSLSEELLQIEPPITEHSVKQAYHKMSLKHHPDKGGDPQKFIEIKNAYDELLLIAC